MFMSDSLKMLKQLVLTARLHLGSYHFLAHEGAGGNGGDRVKIID